MKATIETITPEIAQRWLTKNTNNRGVRVSYVDLLAKEMAEGRWLVNGDAFRFNGTDMIDGQHRAMAIVQSGVTIKGVVIRGLASDTFRTIDAGRKRTVADIFKINGEANYTNLSSTCRMHYDYESGNITAKLAVPSTVLAEHLEKNPGLRDSVQAWNHKIRVSRIVSTTVGCTAHYIFWNINKKLADATLEAIVHGAPSIKSPLHAMRETLIRLPKDREPGESIRVSVYLAIIINGWNAIRTGNTPSSFKPKKNAAFPVAE